MMYKNVKENSDGGHDFMRTFKVRVLLDDDQPNLLKELCRFQTLHNLE